MNTEKKIVEQTLHGYSNGHRLLGYSRKFSDKDIKKMTILSDLSGNEFVRGFEKYYTGYRLNSDMIVLACTWYAVEMKRPGCVWTHSLVFSEEDLKECGMEMGGVFSLFRRPSNNDDFSFYNRSLEANFKEANFNRKKEIDEQKLKYLIWCLWGNRLPLVVFSNNAAEYENEMIYLYLTQQDILNENFSFCTGSVSLRSIEQKIMSFQIAPDKLSRSGFQIGNGVVEAKEAKIIKNYPVWVNKTSDYLLMDDIKDFKRFIMGFSNDFERSNYFSAFMKLYVGSKALSRTLNLDSLLQIAPAIFNDKKRICKEIVELYFQHYFSYWAGKENYVNTLKFFIDNTWLDVQQKDIENMVIGGIESEYLQIKLLFNTIVGSEDNKVVEEILKVLAKNITLDLFEDFTSLKYDCCSIMVTLNVEYAQCQSLWKQNKGFQQGIIRCLDFRQCDEFLKNRILVTVLSVSEYDLAYDLYKIYGETSIDIFWNYVLLNLDRKNVNGIKQIIRKDVSKCIKILKGNLKERKKLFFLIDIIDSYDYSIKDVTECEIRQLYKTLNPESCNKKEQELLARFLIPICLIADYMVETEIVRFAYIQVDHLLATQTFPEYEWEKLEQLLPEVAWYNNWDRCKRLRKGLKKKGYQIKELKEKDELPKHLL